MEVMRPLERVSIVSVSAKSTEAQLSDFYGGSGYMRPTGLSHFRKDDMRLVAALNAVQTPEKAVSGVFRV